MLAAAMSLKVCGLYFRTVLACDLKICSVQVSGGMEPDADVGPMTFARML
jgi:hypothetical protein